MKTTTSKTFGADGKLLTQTITTEDAGTSELLPSIMRADVVKPGIHPIIGAFLAEVSAFINTHASQFPALVADLVAYEQAVGPAAVLALQKLLSDLAALVA